MVIILFLSKLLVFSPENRFPVDPVGVAFWKFPDNLWDKKGEVFWLDGELLTGRTLCASCWIGPQSICEMKRKRTSKIFKPARKCFWLCPKHLSCLLVRPDVLYILRKEGLCRLRWWWKRSPTHGFHINQPIGTTTTAALHKPVILQSTCRFFNQNKGIREDHHLPYQVYLKKKPLPRYLRSY